MKDVACGIICLGIQKYDRSQNISGKIELRNTYLDKMFKLYVIFHVTISKKFLKTACNKNEQMNVRSLFLLYLLSIYSIYSLFTFHNIFGSYC